MKHKIAAAGAIAALALVAGCGSDAVGEGADTGTGSIREIPVDMQDGRTVTCLVYAAGYKGGMSCDWDGATR